MVDWAEVHRLAANFQRLHKCRPPKGVLHCTQIFRAKLCSVELVGQTSGARAAGGRLHTGR